MIFVHVCSTWSIVELKTRFETWITRNEVNGESMNHLYNLITYIAYLRSDLTLKDQIKDFLFDWSNNILFEINTGWIYYSLQLTIFVNVCSTFSVVALKTRFETWIIRNDVNGVRLFLLSYSITLMSYLLSQWTPNVKTSNLFFIGRSAYYLC
jgi:hypothetical protein